MQKNGERVAFQTVLLLVAGLLLLPVSVCAVSVSLEPLSLRPGEIGTSNLTLDNVPSGISGYRTGLRLSVPGIAEITGVNFPAWAGMNDQSGFPGTDVAIMAAALGEPTHENDGRTVLAALTLKGIKGGTSILELYDMTIDDEQGDPVEISLENVSVTVSSETAISESSFYGQETPGGTTAGPESPATTPVSMVTTAIPTGTLPQEQAVGSEPSTQNATEATLPPVTQPDQLPGAATPARGASFLSPAVVLGLLFALVAIGTNRMRR
jgi:hypothetical protein